MRIFSKKAFKFDHPAGQEPAVVVRSNDFATVPNWVKGSAMFKLANAAGDVSIIETKQDEKAAENKREQGGSNRGKAGKDNNNKTDDKSKTAGDNNATGDDGNKGDGDKSENQ